MVGGGPLNLSTSYTSTTIAEYSYDVFLSFRGTDTRKTFTGHLHNALKRERINVFLDSTGLRMGEEIGRELVKAIQESKISIPIFSKGYADSKWCLMELTEMNECRMSNHQIVLPIFFDVDPSNVRHQMGRRFEEAFRKHERHYHPQVVMRWREALKDVASLRGWDLRNIANGDESRLIELVVEWVLRHTSRIRFSNVQLPIGIDDRINDFVSLLDICSNDVQFVGICGQGGIGKTSIAKAFYNRMFKSFDETGFLANIREEASRPKGLVSLQEKLIYSISKREPRKILNVDHGKEEIKKRCAGVNVLLVLDDVDDRSQLDALAIGLDWFGQGSIVIITTRDEHILNVANVHKDKIFRPKELDFEQSLRLFCCHAFQKEEPSEEYIELSCDVARYSGGSPLALEVLGSYLSDIRNKEVWEETLRTLKDNLHEEVHKKLKISYDNLENDHQKIIFLDAACFFVGWEKETLISIWEACGYHPKSAVEKLVRRSLLKFNKYECLEMHDLVRDMGRKIVFQENPMEPSKRSRLWSFEDISEVLEEHNKDTKEINGILLPFDWQNELSIECLAKMSNLRFLDLTHSKREDVPHLPYKLRWFRWVGCPIKVLPDDFYHRGLVHLDLSWSQIQLAWNNRPVNECKKFQKLKVLRLSRCRFLSKCPNFSWFPCLEQLDLNWCESLGDLDDSIGQLSNLKRLILSNCESLSKLPQSIGGLKSLVELQLRKTGIDELPDGVGLLEKLKVLSVEDCNKLVKLPRSMGRMRSLNCINLNGTSISELPNDFTMLSSLVELYLSGNVQEQFNMCSLPIHFSGFSQLQKLKLSACRILESLPADLSNLKNLQELFIGGWEKLQCLLELPSSLTSLECLSCKSLAQLPDLSCLKSLRILSLEDCNNLEKIRGLQGIRSLELFWVERCYKVTDTPRKQYFQVRPLDDGLERYDPLFPSPRCLGALRRLTSNQRPKAGSDLCLESGRLIDYSFSNANDGSCKRLSLIIVFSFPYDLNGNLLQEGELVDIELEISTDIFRKDGKSTQCNHTILIENVEFTVERDIVYIHDLEGFTWFGFPLEGKNAMTELYVYGSGLYKLSDSGIYRRLRYSFSCVKLKFWSLEYVNEESGQALPNQEWVDRIVKDILIEPWPDVDSGIGLHGVFDSHSALIEEEDSGSMQHILHHCGRTRSSQFHNQFVRTQCFGLEEPEEDDKSAEKDRLDSHSILEEPEEDKRGTEEIDSYRLVEEEKFGSACVDGGDFTLFPNEKKSYIIRNDSNLIEVTPQKTRYQLLLQPEANIEEGLPKLCCLLRKIFFSGLANGRLESETTKWTKTELDIFVDAMVEEVIKGNRTSNAFSKTGWENMVECESKLGRPFTLRQLRNKMNKLRTDYGSFKRLLEQSRFSWCDRTGMAETEDPSIWNDHIKENPSWAKFKKNGLPQWPQLCKIFVDSYATGAGGISNTQEHNVIEDHDGTDDDLQFGDDSVGVNLESGPRTTAVQNSKGKTHQQDRTPSALRKKSKHGSLANAINRMVDVSWAMLELFSVSASTSPSPSPTSVASPGAPEFTLSNCMKVLEGMEGLTKELFQCAMTKLTSVPECRELLLVCPEDKRMWLIETWK